MSRILAIDYGRARVGVALSDPLGITVRPLPTLDGRGGGRLFDEIAALCRDEEVTQIVLGLPLQLDGTAGPAAAEVRRFAKKLRSRVEVPIAEVDERLSSKQAHAELKSAGVKHRQRKQRVDSSAALLLLRSWLAARR